MAAPKLGAAQAHGHAVAYAQQEPMRTEPMRQPDSTGTYGAMPEAAPQAMAPAAQPEPAPARTEEPRPSPAMRAAERPFIAPPPVEAPARTSPARAEMPSAPSASAAPSQAHGAGQAAAMDADRRRGPSLFSRVTGSAAAWARGAAADMREATPAAATNRLGSPEPRPAAQAPSRPAQPAQQRLAGLDPRDRISGTQAEEELLDIPAFLRRQAN
jgi:cell division protein FtsZ